MSQWSEHLANVDRLVAGGHSREATQAAGSILEEMLRETYRLTLPKLAPADQQKVLEQAQRIGRNKPVDGFTLGEIVGLFRDSGLFKHAERALNRSLEYIQNAPLATFIRIRNAAVHKGEDVSEEEARFFAAQVRLFARELGFLETPPPRGERGQAGGANLKPWTSVVRLHPDVEAGALTEASFAIDLGAIAADDPNVPTIYKEAEAFFRATYLTDDMRGLLDEVLSSLAGRPGLNRVLKLRTPFGGGKSHSLATLFHAARNRPSLNVLPEARNLPDPGHVCVAVFDGEKFDALEGKALPEGKQIQTMWGWLAWQIDPERAFPLVERHDRDRVAPGGDVIRAVLTQGASGRPVLILLDEVLKYMERAGAVKLADSTLQNQAKDFLQNLTVEVAGTTNAALVYTLTWSPREAFGNMALLQEIDKLANRVDQLREPVTGDDILKVLQRRLLGGAVDEEMAERVADAYTSAITSAWRAYAETPQERQQADAEGHRLRERIRAAYPFHPTLIDLMRERWSARDAFQRTRGALRFLAVCLHTLKHKGGAGPLLGPGDVPLGEATVRQQLVKELGLLNEYDPVFEADLTGPNARARRIDERRAAETPALAAVKPASRLASAAFLYSFGGLKREAQGRTEDLPPGVTERELRSICVSPDLDPTTAEAVLSELRNACLYLHYDGARYLFKKDPNITKLVEDAEQEIAREEAQGQGPVRTRIRELLDKALQGKYSGRVWPAKSQDIDDGEPRFLVAYMPLELAFESLSQQERTAKEYLSKYGDRPRRYRNSLALAMPDRTQVEALRRAVRYLLAVERVEKGKVKLTKDQQDQLKERRRTEASAAESSLRDLYSAVWLPRVENGELGLEKIEKGGKALVATGVHERVMELLTSMGSPKVHGTLKARKIIDRLKLGEATGADATPRLGVKTSDVVDAFFSILEPPRLETEQAIRGAIAEGIRDGSLAYVSGSIPLLGPDGKYQVNLERVMMGRVVAPDEVDLEGGFIMVPSAVPSAPVEPARDYNVAPVVAQVSGGEATMQRPVSSPIAPTGTTPRPNPTPTGKHVVEFSFTATREQIFKAFRALANLADKSDGGKITIHISGKSEKGYDPGWLRNALDEPFDEADIDRS